MSKTRPVAGVAALGVGALGVGALGVVVIGGSMLLPGQSPGAPSSWSPSSSISTPAVR